MAAATRPARFSSVLDKETTSKEFELEHTGNPLRGTDLNGIKGRLERLRYPGRRVSQRPQFII